jgi:hypothetical protein
VDCQSCAVDVVPQTTKFSTADYKVVHLCSALSIFAVDVVPQTTKFSIFVHDFGVRLVNASLDLSLVRA